MGGGTNSSEYEMLSSNSLMLMPSITPFNWLNLHKANSLVSNLKDLGYATLAAHPYTNSNYRRDSAWLTLGFDETHFQDDFRPRKPMAAAPTRPTAPPTATWKVCMKQCRRTSRGLCSWFPSRATAITI